MRRAKFRTVRLIVLGVNPKLRNAGRASERRDRIDEVVGLAGLAGSRECVFSAIKVQDAHHACGVLRGRGSDGKPTCGVTKQDDMVSVNPGFLPQ
jgi:hypothetical protein